MNNQLLINNLDWQMNNQLLINNLNWQMNNQLLINNLNWQMNKQSAALGRIRGLRFIMREHIYLQILFDYPRLDQ